MINGFQQCCISSPAAYTCLRRVELPRIEETVWVQTRRGHAVCFGATAAHHLTSAVVVHGILSAYFRRHWCIHQRQIAC